MAADAEQRAEGAVDLYEPDSLPDEELKKLSSVEFIMQVLDNLGPVPERGEE